MRKLNLIGQKFGRLTVIDKAPDIIYKGGKSKASAWKCQCECGNTTVVDTTSLRRKTTTSCGCLGREQVSKARLKDLTGVRFGRLVVIRRADDYETPSGHKEPRWVCHCDCGNEIITRGSCLKSKKSNTRSCGCLRRELLQQIKNDLIGMKFGMLTVIERADDHITTGGNRYTRWLCKCECGAYTKTIGSRLMRGATSSCGCLDSKGEREISSLLSLYAVDFQREYKFQDLLGPRGGCLRFDFAIIKDDHLVCLIEYQGQQHDPLFEGDFGKAERTITDDLKAKYCTRNHIPLFAINYNENIKERLVSILNSMDLISR